MKTAIKIGLQILIDVLVMVGLLCLMIHLIIVWKLNVVVSSLFGILTGVIIVTIWWVVYLMFHKHEG